MPIRFHIPALTLALCTLAGCHGDVGPTDGDGEDDEDDEEGEGEGEEALYN